MKFSFSSLLISLIIAIPLMAFGIHTIDKIVSYDSDFPGGAFTNSICRHHPHLTRFSIPYQPESCTRESSKQYQNRITINQFRAFSRKKCPELTHTYFISIAPIKLLIYSHEYDLQIYRKVASQTSAYLSETVQRNSYHTLSRFCLRMPLELIETYGY